MWWPSALSHIICLLWDSPICIYNYVLYLLVHPHTTLHVSVHSHLTLTSACCDFPVPISLLAAQLYHPLSEGLTDFKSKERVFRMTTFFPLTIFIQVMEVTCGWEWALHCSVNVLFSSTTKSGVACTVTFLGWSAFTKHIMKKRRIRSRHRQI